MTARKKPAPKRKSPKRKSPKRKSPKKPRSHLHRFVIDRSTWANGHTVGHSSIGDKTMLEHESTGAQCCIGFYAESCGVPSRALRGVSSVDGLADKHRNKLGISDDGDLADFYSRNDDSAGSTKQRETALTRLFRERDVVVRFVGKYPGSE